MIFERSSSLRLLHHIVNATAAATAPAEPKWGPLHLVGHSLGAHICGFAAEAFQKRQNSWKVSRITGLDPANRCFSNVSSSLRLSSDDAKFVDVIHTNGRLDQVFAFGSPHSIGERFLSVIFSFIDKSMELEDFSFLAKKSTFGEIKFYKIEIFCHQDT